MTFKMTFKMALRPLTAVAPVLVAVCVFVPHLAAAGPGYDSQTLRGSCSGSAGSCASSVNGMIKDLKDQKLDDSEYDSQLGYLATDLADYANDAPDVGRSAAQGIQVIAAHSRDKDQKKSLQDLAHDLRKASPVNPPPFGSDS